MKYCSKCQNEKPLSDFYSKTKTTTQAYCKACFNAYCIERWVETKKKAIEYKGGGCTDCPIKFDGLNYYLFDFHHLNAAQKDVDWTKLRLRSWNRITEELDKCDLLCSNCHRTRHWKREIRPSGIEPESQA